MKRTLSLLLALVFLLALTPAVHADVIWVPEDPFLEDHMDQCTYLQRGYYAAGPNGSVTVYASPESPTVVKKLTNGEYVFIVWSYTDADGIAWGLCEYYGDESWDGWIPMDYLLLKYDSQAFREEFADRIRTESGTAAECGPDTFFWNYPGSEDATTFSVEGDYLPEYQQTFTDDAGRAWGYIGYYMGIRNVWICLDDPTADYDTLYANHAPQAVTHPVQPDPGTLDEIKPGGIAMETILLAAAAVAVASGAFLWFTRKKKT